MSRYTHVGMAIATTKQAGNILAAAFAVEPGDATAFDNAIPLYAPGTTYTDAMDGPLRVKLPSAHPVAWCISVLMTEQKASESEALIAAGLPEGVTAQTYPRATHEFALTEILAALGYEIIPPA